MALWQNSINCKEGGIVFYPVGTMSKAAKKILWTFYQPYKWLFVFPFMFIDSIFFAILAVLLSKFISEKAGSYYGGVMWARLNTFIIPFFIKIRGRKNVDKKQSYVIVANHLSNIDIFALYGWLGIDFKWVMKKEVRKIPGVGFGSATIGHIFIDRSNTQKAIESINKVREKIKDGTSVVFFPEGTRSRTSELLPFKKGAFRLAFDLDLPILPITINGTDKVWRTNTYDLFPGKVELVIHPAVETSRYSLETINEFMAETRKIIASARSDVK